MALAERALEVKARRAYERGRVTFGLQRALPVSALSGLALIGCAHPLWAGACVLTLALLLGVLLWRGQEFADGVKPGLLAGLVPFALPVLSQTTGYFCSATMCSVLPTVCVAGGVVGGVALGAAARRPFREHVGFWVSAVAVTAVLGSAGCLVAGFAGLLGLAVGLLLGSVPVLVARAA